MVKLLLTKHIWRKSRNTGQRQMLTNIHLVFTTGQWPAFLFSTTQLTFLETWSHDMTGLTFNIMSEKVTDCPKPKRFGKSLSGIKQCKWQNNVSWNLVNQYSLLKMHCITKARWMRNICSYLASEPLTTILMWHCSQSVN